RAMDEGLTAGVICISNTKANFAGAKIDLNIRTENELYVIKGDRKTIGYSKTDNHDFTVNELSSKANNVYYLTTDGYLDQNGGDKNHCFGKKRFYSLIEEYYSKPLQEQKKFFVEALNEYMQDKAQRDDVTVIGFKIREK
ncbi:MAG: PP2C family protein-serine/threonine phosphatase, partial [bacterium]